MLSEALRLLRVYHDMKQKDLAKKLGLSSSHVSEIESGNKTPSLEVVQKYAALFKIPVSSIMFFSEQIEGVSTKSAIETRAKNAIASKIISLLKAIELRTETSDA